MNQDEELKVANKQKDFQEWNNMFDDEKYFKTMHHLIDFFHEKLNVTWDCVGWNQIEEKILVQNPLIHHTQHKNCTYSRSSTPCRIGLASHTDHFTPSFFGSLDCSNGILECQLLRLNKHI